MAGQRASSLIDVDASEFLSTLKAAFARMELQSEAQLVAVGIQVTNAAKEYCPVATGRLRSSILSTEVMHDTARSAYILVGTDVEYAPFVEYGTSRMSAQPFMRPALAEVSGGAFRLLTDDSQVAA